MSLLDTFKKILKPESSDDKPQPDSHVQAPPVEDPPASSEPLFGIYTVQPGDTLSKIAERELHDAGRWPEIAEANRATLPDPDKIKPGQQLKIPR
ncbi:LysM peptidoglycan-binding domain-containing protein [Pseudomonas sp. PCH446]